MSAVRSLGGLGRGIRDHGAEYRIMRATWTADLSGMRNRAYSNCTALRPHGLQGEVLRALSETTRAPTTILANDIYLAVVCLSGGS